MIAAGPATVKELKVKIPLRHHARLHADKILGGPSIAAAVTLALEMYFENQRPRP